MTLCQPLVYSDLMECCHGTSTATLWTYRPDNWPGYVGPAGVCLPPHGGRCVPVPSGDQLSMFQEPE